MALEGRATSKCIRKRCIFLASAIRFYKINITSHIPSRVDSNRNGRINISDRKYASKESVVCTHKLMSRTMIAIIL